MLRCPVRNCHLELVHRDRRFLCARDHSFDIARSGYINLLQPQDRRSKTPGDTIAAVAGRRRLHDQGATRPLLQAIDALALPKAQDTVLDAGCGEGFYLANLTNESPTRAHGIDISIPAIDAAARRYPASQWIVANADRFIPYADHSFSLVLSITARMNAPEFHRILRPDGRLLVAIPAPEDFIELRGTGQDRTARTIGAFANFTLLDRQRVTTTAHLDAAAVQDVLHSIYRPLQSQAPAAMNVTLSLDLLLFRP